MMRSTSHRHLMQRVSRSSRRRDETELCDVSGKSSKTIMGVSVRLVERSITTVTRSVEKRGRTRRRSTSFTSSSSYVSSLSFGAHTTVAPSESILASSTLAESRASGQGMSAAAPHAPSMSQLKSLFVSSAIPMVGFGFMDNFIMITAGGYIDATLGVKFGLATMTAAAMGQVFSDVGGVMFGGAMERALAKLDLIPPSNLSQAQRALPVCRNVSLAGAILGVTTGCLLGAGTLLMNDQGVSEKKRRLATMDRVLQSMLQRGLNSEEGGDFIRAERCCVYFLDEERDELWSETRKSADSEDVIVLRSPVEGSLVGKAFKHNCVVNEENLEYEGTSFKGNQKKTDMQVDSVLCVPVHAADGRVVAVVEFANKKNSEKDGGGFTETDEKLANMLANHVGIFLEEISESD